MKIFPQRFDWVLFFSFLTLVVLGIISIYTASAVKFGPEFIFKSYYIKQIIWFSIAMVIFFFILHIPKHIFDIFIYPAFFLNIILLIIVLFTPEVNGSHRWIRLGGFHFQPSEVAKITTILMIAKVISKDISEYKILLYGIGLTLIPVVLIIIEPDMGTSLVFFFVLFFILTMANIPKYFLVLLIAPFISMVSSAFFPAFIVFIVFFILILIRFRLSWFSVTLNTILNTFIFFITPVFWNNMHEYQRNRILTFLDPTRDPFGAGYQVIQSKIAIGSGGLNGKGFLLGTQKNLNFLPEHHTDFIFSVIGEELGFIGCSVLLFFFFLFLTQMIRGLNRIPSFEKRLTIIGIFAYFLFQIFINIGMNIGVAPTTGIPLPFISYGGSNLIINVAAVAIVLKYRTEIKKWE